MLTDTLAFLVADDMPGLERGFKSLLQKADDLLFVLKEDGRIVNYKFRSGNDLHTGVPTGTVNIRDILPATVLKKFSTASARVRRSFSHAVFEAMVVLVPGMVGWYEFRLIPTHKGTWMLFIWNMEAYRDFSWTVPNVPISTEKTIEGWSRLLYLRDFETEDHTRRVTEMAVNLARRLDFGEQELAYLRRGAQVHDIGKIIIPDEILLKPGKLTEAEWSVMRQHPLAAVGLLRSIPGIEPALLIPRSHHEKWDGSGYPDALAGDAIPLQARIFAFADVYDALISDRPYRKAWSPKDALDYIANESGRHFDPALAPEFLAMMHEPPSTLAH